MAHFSPFTALRTMIHQAQQQGRLVPSPAAARKRFETLVINEISPLLKHLASILSQDGLPASAAIGLDNDPPYVELRIQESEVQLLCVPTADFRHVTFSIRFLREGPSQQTRCLPFHGTTGARLSFLLEEMLIDVLLPPIPPI